MFATTFFQVSPSRVTCRLPSSVPAHRTPARTGDSLERRDGGKAATPSLRDSMVRSSTLRPMMLSVLRSTFVGQVGRDSLPVVALVRGFENEIPAVVDRLAIVLRDQHRRIPLEAVARHLVVVFARANAARFMRAQIAARRGCRPATRHKRSTALPDRSARRIRRRPPPCTSLRW